MEAFIAEFGLKILGVLIAFFGVFGYGLHKKKQGEAEVSGEIARNTAENLINDHEETKKANEKAEEDIANSSVRERLKRLRNPVR